MLGIITAVRPYKKEGIDKVMVQVLGSDGFGEMFFYTKSEWDSLKLESKALTPKELTDLFAEYETVPFEYRKGGMAVLLPE